VGGLAYPEGELSWRELVVCEGPQDSVRSVGGSAGGRSRDPFCHCARGRVRCASIEWVRGSGLGDARCASAVWDDPSSGRGGLGPCGRGGDRGVRRGRIRRVGDL